METIQNKLESMFNRGLLPEDLTIQVKPASFHGIVTKEDVKVDTTKVTRKLVNKLIKRHLKWYKQKGSSHLHLQITVELTGLLKLIK